MMRRRIVAVCLIVVLLVVPVVVYSQAVPAVAIWGATTAGAAWTAASELVLTVRAALLAPAFYSAATWVSTTLAPAAASLAVNMCLVGAIGLGAAWTAYIAYQGWQYVNGELRTVPTGYTWSPDAQMASCIGIQSEFVQYQKDFKWTAFRNSTDALAACQADGITCARSVTDPVNAPAGWVGTWGEYYFTRYNGIQRWNYRWPVSGQVGTWVQTDNSTPVTPTQAQNTIVTDLTGTDANKKAAAQEAVKAATTTIVNIYNPAKKDNVWPPPALPGQNPIPQSHWDAWEDALKAGISDTDKSAMGAQDTTTNYGLDASNPPIALVGPIDAGLTEEQVKNAVKEGIEEAEEDLQPPDVPGPPPLGTDPDPPDKFSLTAILEDYTDNLETLPIVGIVSGAHLDIAGADPVLDLPVTIPPNPPVNVRIDFSKYESIVDTLGTLMLTYVSIIWTVWLFKGRGDA